MYNQVKYERVSKTFYDGLDNGLFKGLKCPECGNIEFPPYPVCNKCGHIGNEWVELDGDVTINEVYSISPMMTIPEFMPYAPLFSGEVSIPGGSDISTLIFGITRQNYTEMSENVPLEGKLVVMPMDGYSSFAVAVNGASPVRKEVAGIGMNQEELIKTMAQRQEKSEGHPADGTYNFTAKAMGRTQNGKMTIMVEGGKLSGVIDIMDTVAELKDGKLTGENFEFSIEARGAELTFSGLIADGKISGTAKFGVIKLKLEGVRE